MDHPFPCPFCRSSAVTLAGGGVRFGHYRCETCAEVWTAQVAKEVGRPRNEGREVVVMRASRDKVLLH